MNSPAVHDAQDSPNRQDAESATWRPGAAMTVEHAAALWADVRSHVANGAAGAAMEIDLSAVERLDTAGCQVLLACREEARARGAAWRLTGCGPQAVEVMRLLGCDGVLMEEMER
jgi:anti-anti-sigma regulatory factor